MGQNWIFYDRLIGGWVSLPEVTIIAYYRLNNHDIDPDIRREFILKHSSSREQMVVSMSHTSRSVSVLPEWHNVGQFDTKNLVHIEDFKISWLVLFVLNELTNIYFQKCQFGLDLVRVWPNRHRWHGESTHWVRVMIISEVWVWSTN